MHNNTHVDYEMGHTRDAPVTVAEKAKAEKAIKRMRRSLKGWLKARLLNDAAAMGKVLIGDVLDQLNSRGEKLRAELNTIAEQHDTCIQFTGAGSLMALHSTRQPIYSVKNLTGCDDRVAELVFLDLLERGYYIARRGYMALMLSVGDRELSGFKQAFADVMRSRAHLLGQAMQER